MSDKKHSIWTPLGVTGAWLTDALREGILKPADLAFASNLSIEEALEVAHGRAEIVGSSHHPDGLEYRTLAAANG